MLALGEQKANTEARVRAANSCLTGKKAGKMIRLTVKGLAKFMTGRPAAQRKVLRDFKFPQPEGRVQTLYYREARQAIRDYHGGGNDPALLVGAVDSLRAAADRSEGQTRARLEHNIRALKGYLKNFADKQLKILKTPRLEYAHGEVLVTASPDLFVQDNGRQKFIKLELGADAPDTAMVRVILQVMHDAAKGAGLIIRPQDVIYLDASRAVQYKGAKTRSRLQRDIEAACENIEAMWDGIK
jgi:hypothetical protein